MSPYTWAFVISISFVIWVWMLTFVARAKPAMGPIVVCLSTPYLAWAYLPGKITGFLGIALVSGSLRTPTLPGLLGTDFGDTGIGGELVGTIILVIVAGLMHGSLAGLVKVKTVRRLPGFVAWVLAEQVAAAVTTLYLFTGHLLELYGPSPLTISAARIAYAVVYVPVQIVILITGHIPSVEGWGHFELGRMLTEIGFLETLIAFLVVIPIYICINKYHRN